MKKDLENGFNKHRGHWKMLNFDSDQGGRNL